MEQQVVAAELCVLAKIDLAETAALGSVRTGLARHEPGHRVLDARDDLAPALRLFGAGPISREAGQGSALRAADGRFETASGIAAGALPALQAAMGRLAQRLLRAGRFVAGRFVAFAHEPGRPMPFQLVGSRATIVPAPVSTGTDAMARLVLIAEALGLLDACIAPSLEVMSCGA